MKRVVFIVSTIIFLLLSSNPIKAQNTQLMTLYRNGNVLYSVHLTVSDSISFSFQNGERMFNHIRTGNVIRSIAVSEIDSVGIVQSNGCDTAIENEINIIACMSYTWNEEIYTEGGDYFQFFTSENGCDSIVTLHLTIVIEEGIEINGVRWATRNVNAPNTFVVNPEDAGMFYQWNRRVGWSSLDPIVNSEGGTAWDNSIPPGNSWVAENYPCPAGWRLPTHDEFLYLMNLGSTWDYIGNVPGRFLGNGEERLFFPAAGNRNDNGTLYDVGISGRYWSSTIGSGLNIQCMYFDPNYAYPLDNSRNYAFSVRCVAE